MYSWVSNAVKYNRAIKELETVNKNLKIQGRETVEITEEAVRALYLKYGGLVIGEPETQLGVPEGVIAPPVIKVEEEEEEVKPRKRNAK